MKKYSIVGKDISFDLSTSATYITEGNYFTVTLKASGPDAVPGLKVPYRIGAIDGELPYGPWSIQPPVIVTEDTARYVATKANAENTYKATINYNLIQAIIRSLNDADNKLEPAVLHAASTLTSGRGFSWNDVDDIIIRDEYSESAMVLKTANNTSDVTLGLVKGNHIVDWGDGTVQFGLSGVLTHTYASPGKYTIVVEKDGNDGGTDGFNTMVLLQVVGIEEVVQWWADGYEVLGFTAIFNNTDTTLRKVPSVAPRVFQLELGGSSVMFQRCSVFNDPSILTWDTSNWQNMSMFFYQATNFNQPIGQTWSFENATTVNAFLYEATNYNQPWDTMYAPRITDLETGYDSMFSYCYNMEQDLSNWCVPGIGSLTIAEFAYGSKLTAPTMPQWGICPLGEFSSVTYDPFYQTITVNGGANTLYTTVDPFNNVIGSGTTNSSGTVTYNINEGMLRGGTIISTSSSNSNVVNHALTASFFVGSDATGHNVTFEFTRDQHLNWLDNVEEGFSNTLEGEVIIEYSTGITYIVDLSEHQGKRFGVYVSEFGINVNGDAETSKVGLVTAKVRFRNVNDKMFITTAQTTHAYKFFDDGVTDVGYQLLYRNSSPDVSLKVIPEYLPTAMTRLNAMFWNDSSSIGAFASPSVAAVLENWDVSNIEAMCSTFSYGVFGNLPVSNWNPINLKYAIETFSNSDFNADINWNTPKLERVTYMFGDSSDFNGNINLTMNNVVDADSFLTGCSSFNKPIDHLNTGNVKIFDSFLSGCSSFNQPVNNLNVSSGETFVNMFANCSIFNQPLDQWNMSSLKDNPQNVGLYFFLHNATSFSQDLSMLCVVPYSSEPAGFNTNGIMTDEQKPVWGTCAIKDIPEDVPVSDFSEALYVQTADSSTLWIEWEFDPANPNTEFYIDWGDGKKETHRSIDYTKADPDNTYVYLEHVYSTEGNYTVKTASNKKVTYMSFGELTSLLSWGRPTAPNIQIGSSTLVQVPTTLHPEITDLSRMFSWTTSFNQDLSTWDTSNVTNMSQLFANSQGYTQSLSSWDVSNVTNMKYMFGWSNFSGSLANWVLHPDVILDSIFLQSEVNQDISSWDVSSVKSFEAMFRNAYSFNQPLNSWNTSSATSFKSMFASATSFNQPLSSWNTSNVTTMSEMFWGASNFNNTISGWNTSNVTDMSYMFRSTPAFNQDIGSWNVAKVTTIEGMFWGASSFNKNLNNWVTTNLTRLTSTFREATLFNGSLAGWDVSKVVDCFATFASCFNFNGELTGWVLSSTTNCKSMFENANVFNQPVNTFNLVNCTDISYMFYNCYAFNQPIDQWNITNKVTLFTSLFYNNYVFNQEVNHFNTSNVTNFGWTFYNCYAFNKPLSNWNVSKGTNFKSMFVGNQVFNQNITGWVTSAALNMEYMFNNATAFNQNISTWRVGTVTAMYGMFWNAQAFNQNLSQWCMTKITSKPGNFDTGATAYTLSRPVWGTCPRGY